MESLLRLSRIWMARKWMRILHRKTQKYKLELLPTTVPAMPVLACHGGDIHGGSAPLPWGITLFTSKPSVATMVAFAK
jgi:hypothetical protein